MAQKGKFITFEGGEGCGKSTHIERLAARLRGEGYPVLIVREPGGTEVGEQIRHILQYSKQSTAMVAETELLLFSASRAQLVREVILPALRKDCVVLCDRFFDSTTVYQGVGRKIDPQVVATINAFAIDACRPNLTLVIDLDPRTGLERARGRELFDRMENQSLEFYERVRQGYLDLARRDPERVKVVDGSQPVEKVGQQIWDLIKHVL
ncbi:MAG TPA: dTMP kinase [Verrucomicrobiae bacterium]|nr:dTMP kinase [Verrucomicrobiae bacterium]